MPNPVVHFEILGKDGAQLQKYYADLFGWEVKADNPMNYGLVAPQGSGIGGGISASEHGRNGVHIYIAVKDMQATLEKAVSLGGKVVVDVTEIPNMVTFAMFQDPQGNIVGIVKDDVAQG